jgi:hypothetical protein
MLKYLLISSFFLFATIANAQKDTLTALQAKDYVGKQIVVKDIIAGARLFERPEKTTFLINLAERYPNTPLTVVLYDTVYKALSQKENLDNKTLIVNGTVSIFNQKLQIVVEDIKQLTIK